MSIFKKEDIKAGYLLKVKDTETGETFNMTVVPTIECKPSFLAELLGVIPHAEGDLAVCCPGENWWGLPDFDDDLVQDGTCCYQVVAVYGYTAPKFLLDNSTEERELLWEREEEQPTEDTQPEVKKMTVAEIAEALGHPVEIVEG
jgi:hypothetical protein